MSTIVYQDFKSCSESNIIETTTLKLKVPTPTTIVETITPTYEKCWSSLRNLSTISNLNSNEKENSYVQPSSKKLSEKSLALCTENLGSETGTDQCIDSNIFSFSSHESKTAQLALSVQVESNYNKVMTYNSTEIIREFPPPLTTLRGSNAIQVRPHREGGRLVIKAAEATKVHPCFHAERSNGRLRLCLLNDGCSAFENEINDEEEEEEREDEEEEEENGMHMKRDMDGNSYDAEAEIGIVNCQRIRRCKEGRQGNKTFCDWRNPLWVATS
ncbi:putative dirigent protein 21-like [Capsicum annuum]|nr:putative dirigent protein 21-like [Capsicum annuum]KAF3669099.1 putative dirigent protein 21-like [Capsicum annuum]